MKRNLIKPIAICFAITILLTFLIPAGSYGYGFYTEYGSTIPLGLLDVIKLPIIAFSQLAIIGVIFLIIGGIYGVLNETSVYSRLIEDITKKFKTNQKTFLMITTVFFAVLSSITGSAYVLFALVPFFLTLLKEMKFGKFTSLTATVVAMLVGRIASTTGSTVTNYVNGYFYLEGTDNLLLRFILLFILTNILALFVLKVCRKEKLEDAKLAKVEKEEKVVAETKVAKKTTTKTATKKSATKATTKKKPTTKKTTTKKKTTKNTMASVMENDLLYVKKSNEDQKSYMPLVVISVLTLIFCFIGTFDWYGTFGLTWFDDLFTAITEFTVFDYPLFYNLLGSIVAFGEWSTYEIAYALMVLPILITFIYNIKIETAFKAFIKGVKQMLPVAGMVMLANVVFVSLAASSTGYTIFATMENYLLTLTDGFNLATTSLVTLLGSFFYNDLLYAVYNIAVPVETVITDTAVYSLISIIVQTLHGLTMLILPTSLFLVAGLTYLDISFKEYFAYIWKFLLGILGILVAVFIVLAIFI